MKNKATIILLIAIILSSCGMSNNFNSQKFTSLKKIKPQKTEQQFEEDDLAQTSEENTAINTTEEQGINPQSSETVFTESTNDLDVNDEVSNSFLGDASRPQKEANTVTPEKMNIQLDDEKPNKAEEQKKEDNMFIWMMVMFILAAPASIFVVIPAIPFYLTAFILAILLLRRINKIPYKERSRKQNIRRGLAIWVLVQWALGLALVGILILYI